MLENNGFVNILLALPQIAAAMPTPKTLESIAPSFLLILVHLFKFWHLTNSLMERS